ncbi:hypothetical protein JOQ06_006218 [Pogonophryne albipinna]|uniref:Uncharacterized protein n=1 Tax=Pogonophryne albipinna TaxID=1090488 RepID=A0AAD6FQ37_9TELE|nr:hypothetical protein JOQ06_006218 [Pogonophryne albipinna]
MFDEDAEDVFSYTLLYSIIYPSLHDNNILRRVLMCEVVYWAEKLKRRWIAEETGERDDTDYLCQAEGEGGECFRASERHVDTEETQTAACGAEMKTLVDQEEEDGELFWRHSQPDSDKWRRRVSVPLAVLWCCCPKVSVLSGSVSNLRLLLMDEPGVKLSQDGSAMLLNHQEQDLDDDDDDEEEHSAEPEEDWEANV